MKDLSALYEKEVGLKEYLVRIGDLINIDGPILTLFSDVRNEHLYLYDWVDSDDSANRFLIYAVPPQGVLDYLSKRITHRDLFVQSINGRYNIADICPHKFSSYRVFQLKHLPQDFQDIETTLFDEQFCKDVQKILYFVTRIGLSSSNDLSGGEIIFDIASAPDKVNDITSHISARFGEFNEGYFMATVIHSDFESLIESSDLVSTQADTEEIYFNLNRVFKHVRRNNQLPAIEGLALYREQRQRDHSL